MPLSTAYLVWTLGQAILLAWLLRLLHNFTRSWEPHERWLLLSAVIAFPSLMLTFMLGAHSLLLTLCLFQLYLALKNGREAWAGLWLLPGTIKPQAVLLPGVILLAARRWRALFNALIIGVAWALFSAVILGWRIWLDYLLILRTHAGLFDAFGVVPADMHNLKGTLAIVLGNNHSVLISQVSYVALLAAIVMAVWLWRRPWQPDDPSFELRMALTIVLGLLFNVHTNPQDSLILIVPATLFYAYLRQRNLPRRAFAVFALLCPFIILMSEFLLKDSLGIRVPVVAMIVFLVWMGKALYDEHKA